MGQSMASGILGRTSYIHIYIYIPAKPKTQEFLGQSKITGYLDTALEISRAPLKFGFWGKNA